jgi:hypothetical protein
VNYRDCAKALMRERPDLQSIIFSQLAPMVQEPLEDLPEVVDLTTDESMTTTRAVTSP